MRGDDEVIALLNEQLTSELTAINQHFLHAKTQANWGLTTLAERTRAESIEEIEHAELLTDRVLVLDGLPNCQRPFPVCVGQTVTEQVGADLTVERDVVDRLRAGIAMCREKGDITPANLHEKLLADEEHHIDYLETQLELIDKLGEQLHLVQLVDRPPAIGQLRRRLAARRRDAVVDDWVQVGDSARCGVPAVKGVHRQARRRRHGW